MIEQLKKRIDELQGLKAQALARANMVVGQLIEAERMLEEIQAAKKPTELKPMPDTVMKEPIAK